MKLLSGRNLLLTLALVFSFSAAAQLPDLVVTNVSWSGVPTAGQTLAVSFVATNVGSGTVSGQWSDGFVLSTNTSRSGAVAGGVYHNYGFGSRFVGVGGGLSFNWNIPLPSVAPGNYYLIGVVNDTTNFVEADYVNNALAVPITIGATDLAVTNFNIGATAIAGMSLPISFTVANVATNSYSSYWYDGVTLSTNATLTGAITNWDWYSYHSVLPGGTYVQSQTITLPRIAAGNYYLIARTDNRSFVPESDKTNNLQAIALVVTNQPAAIVILTPTNQLGITSCVPTPFKFQATTQLGSYLVTNVVFYANGLAIGHFKNAPYRTNSPALTHGDYTITAKAFDNFGLVGISTQNVSISLRWPTNLHELRTDIATNGDFVGCMCAYSGSNYLVQYTTNLSPNPVWLPYVTNQALNDVLSFTNSYSNRMVTPQKYFRTVLFPLAVQIPGLPTLSIARTSATTATIAWLPGAAGYRLQETSSLSSANWTNSPSGTNNPVIVPLTAPVKYYRLTKA